MTRDELGAFIDTLRHQLAAGTLPPEQHERAVALLNEVDFFLMSDRWKEHPDLWEPVRRRLADNLRRLRDDLA